MSQHASMELLLRSTAALAVIIGFACLCGLAFRRFRQPSVVGEMVAGILLGPSLLGWLWPSGSNYLFNSSTRPVLYVLAMIGLCLYMFSVGAQQREHASGTNVGMRFPVTIAGVGIFFPFLLVGLTAWLIAFTLKPSGAHPWIYCLFVGGAMSVTAFPMLSRILQERGMESTRFGSIAIRAAAIDDGLAWISLSVLSAFAQHRSKVGVIISIVGSVVFIVVCLKMVPRLLRPLMERAVRIGTLSHGFFAGLICMVLAAGWITDKLGMYSIFGGFVLGASLPAVPGFYKLVSKSMIDFVKCFMLPVFFVYSGLNTNLRELGSSSNIAILTVIIVIGFAAKYVGVVGISRSFGMSWGRSSALGGMMNARGLMILIYINAGLSIGIIDYRMYSMLVVLAVITTMLAYPIYRIHFTQVRELRELSFVPAAASKY